MFLVGLVAVLPEEVLCERDRVAQTLGRRKESHVITCDLPSHHLHMMWNIKKQLAQEDGNLFGRCFIMVVLAAQVTR